MPKVLSDGSELVAPFARRYREVEFSGKTYLLGDYSEAERQQFVASWADDPTLFGAPAKLSEAEMNKLLRARVIQVCLFRAEEQRALPTDHATTAAIAAGSAGRINVLYTALSELLGGKEDPAKN